MKLALEGDERALCVIGSHSTQGCNSLIVNWAHDQGMGDGGCGLFEVLGLVHECVSSYLLVFQLPSDL